MHTFTHFTRFLYDCNQIHCIFLWKFNMSPIEGKKIIFQWTSEIQYNVPAPRANECCNELGVWRWEFIDPPAEDVYHDPAFSKKLDVVVLMFWSGKLWGLGATCVSQTAGDCGELQAIGSLELGLWSGGSSPFFMIFFSFDLLFWNQILT